MTSIPRALAATLPLIALGACVGPGAAARNGAPAGRGEWGFLGQAGVTLAGPDPFQPLPVNNAGFVSDTRGIAVCYPADILVTDDGGRSWRRPRMPLANGAFNSLEILGPMAWTSGGDSLRVSSDGGETWRELPAYGSIYAAAAFFSFVTPEIGWYSQGLNRGSAHALAMTRDGGSTWNPVPMPPEAEDRIMAVALVSETTGFILLTPGVVLRTDDGGGHWARLPLPLGAKRPVSENLGSPVDALRFSDLLRGTAVVYLESPRGFAVFETEDGGKTWREEELPPEPRTRFGNVFLSRDRRYLTVTDLDSGKILRYRRGE